MSLCSFLSVCGPGNQAEVLALVRSTLAQWFLVINFSLVTRLELEIVPGTVAFVIVLPLPWFLVIAVVLLAVVTWFLHLSFAWLVFLLYLYFLALLPDRLAALDFALDAADILWRFLPFFVSLLVPGLSTPAFWSAAVAMANLELLFLFLTCDAVLSRIFGISFPFSS